MVARITFRSEIYIEGENLGEIKAKFSSIPVYNDKTMKSNNLGFVEVVSVDNEDNGEELEHEWNNI